MRILFLSDIHGSLPALDAVLRYYDAHHYDLLVLLGDILNYGPRNGLCQGLDPQAIAERLNEPTFPKGGNPPTFATYAEGNLAIRTLDGTALSSLKL